MFPYITTIIILVVLMLAKQKKAKDLRKKQVLEAQRQEEGV